MVTTARDIITDALRKIQIIGVGQSLNSDEASHAIQTLNDFLNMASVDGCVTFQDTKETFSLTGASSYTIVSGGDFNTTAPVEIKSVFVTVGGSDYEAKKIGESDYASISDKSATGSNAYCYYYDDNYPTARLYLYPAPSSGTITLYSRKYLTEFSSLSSQMSMPAQYRSMLVHNLAVWIAPEYGIEAAPTIKSIASKTYSVVKKQNNRNNPLSMKLDVPSSYDGLDYDIMSGGQW